MLPQETAFPIMIMQQSIQIISMLQQETAFPIIIQQSVRIASMFQHEITFTIMIVHYYWKNLLLQ